MVRLVPIRCSALSLLRKAVPVTAAATGWAGGMALSPAGPSSQGPALPRSPTLQPVHQHLPLSCLIPLGFWAEGSLYRSVRAGQGGDPQECQSGAGSGAGGSPGFLRHAPVLGSAVHSYLEAKRRARCWRFQPPLLCAFALK